LASPVISARRLRVGAGAPEAGERRVPEETPVAIIHDGATHAVMMATPADLEDFAIGFSLTEGVIKSLGDVRSLDVAESALGIELRMWLAPGRGAQLAARRRTLAGPTGCGLCGIESLELVQRPGVRTQLADFGELSAHDVREAVAALDPVQALGRETRAAHAAGLWRPGQGLVAIREDVGRHNALDKLAGALARASEPADGVLAMTSRVSIELVQKAAAIGAPVIAAVSAPTALAIRAAEEAGMTLIAVARADSFEVFAGAARIRF
jgi:FdhD protein